jgi:hypothetical protein
VDCNEILTDDELACFRDIFSQAADGFHTATANEPQHHLTVMTEIPQMVAKVLGHAKLTLLAEISHYKLWFPLTLQVDALGQFTPTLGVPEVLELQGKERSWRLTNVSDVTITVDGEPQALQVRSLSSSGIAIQLPDPMAAERLMASRNVEMRLAEIGALQLDFEPVRYDSCQLAARINAVGKEREALRQFIFERHRAEYAHLYQNIA